MPKKLSNARNNTNLNIWVLQKLDALPITRSNSNSQKENTRNTINFTT